MAKCKNCKKYDTKARWCETIDDSPDNEMERDCECYERMTNADRIRSMTDDELAYFIEQVSVDSMDTISFGTKHCEEIWEHEETALIWLQSEVEE